MSQRNSGYLRKADDVYETPSWVTHVLCDQLDINGVSVWEPACASGQMVSALVEHGARVNGTDIRIDRSQDFLSIDQPAIDCQAIITNPPYELAREFCEHALALMKPAGGIVAMLLRTDFDHAVSRSHLFGNCPAFAKKLVLTKRIAWFVEANGRPKASPSYNHAWYIWDWGHSGPPIISYGPSSGKFNHNVNLPERRKSAIGASHADLFPHLAGSQVTAAGTGQVPGRDARPPLRAVGAPSGTRGDPAIEGAAP